MEWDAAPEWPSSENDATYLASVEGNPDMECRLIFGLAEGHDAGNDAIVATAMRADSAIPFVVAAEPGPP